MSFGGQQSQTHPQHAYEEQEPPLSTKTKESTTVMNVYNKDMMSKTGESIYMQHIDATNSL